MTCTQDTSLTKLTKKIEILNSPLDIDKKRDITVLNTTESSDNEDNDKHIRNTICHKCKQYGHTKKQCNRHNKIVKQISKLEFEKNVINELMEMFNIKQKEMDQVKKKEELKSTNTLKVNKRKRKQKDIIMKLIDCKVEFIQPSNWLYSVPNLLVFQHLVTLYLGGFDVRVVSEIE